MGRLRRCISDQFWQRNFYVVVVGSGRSRGPTQFPRFKTANVSPSLPALVNSIAAAATATATATATAAAAAAAAAVSQPIHSFCFGS